MSTQKAVQESRRVRYTRNALQEGLLSLLEEKPINKITISMVCAKADIHRSTFYMYYKDVYDLLNQIENSLYEELFRTITEKNVYLPSRDVLTSAYETVYQHRKLCRVLFGKYGNRDFLQRVAGIYREVVLEEWKKIAHHLDKKTLEYIHTFSTFTNMGIIEKWVANNFAEPPAELAEMASCFLLQGVSCYLSIPTQE